MPDNTTADAWFSLANKLLDIGYEIAASAGPEIQRNDDHAGDIRLMAVSLIARSLSNMRGTLAMVAEKRLVEARALARCILENQFWLVGFMNAPNKFRSAVIDDDLNRRGSKGRALFETGEMPDHIEKSLCQWMGDNKRWKTSKSVTPKQLARDAQIGDSYVFYDLLSSDAHPTVFTLNRHVVSTKEGEITDIDLDPEPTAEELAETTALGCFGLVNVLVGGCRAKLAARYVICNEQAMEELRRWRDPAPSDKDRALALTWSSSLMGQDEVE